MQLMPGNYLLQNLGERALLLRVLGDDEVQSAALIQAIRTQMQGLYPNLELVPAYAELCIAWTDASSKSAVRQWLTHFLETKLALTDFTGGLAKQHSIEVDYSGQDLAAVAKTCELDVAALIQLHSGAVYRVMALGFQPGFAYLAGLPPALWLPRLPKPRRQVPAGSVAIAADQCAVYPHASPGGWHLLGTTAMDLFDEHSPTLSRFQVGDEVRFINLAAS